MAALHKTGGQAIHMTGNYHISDSDHQNPVCQWGVERGFAGKYPLADA